MTVEEFNKLFKDAEIQFIGSESDLNKKLAGKASPSKLQYSKTEGKNSQSPTVKIDPVGTGEGKKPTIKTSVSVSTSTSTSDGHSYHSVIQPRENAGRAASDAAAEAVEVTTKKHEPTSSKKPVPENKDNLFGARLKSPRSLLQKQRS